MRQLMMANLLLVRAACHTAILAIDAVLEADDTDTPGAPAPEPNPDPGPAPQPVFNSDPSLCEHPQTHWSNAPVMGHPNRVVCKCGTILEVK